MLYTDRLQLESFDTRNHAEQIAGLIAIEEKMLHPSVENVQASIDFGLASYICESGQVIAFCRFIPLFSHLQKKVLGISDDSIPDIWELGSVIVRKDMRGQKKGQGVLRNLHLMYQKQIADKKLLIIGTTTTRDMLAAVSHVKEFGINYSRIRHNDPKYNFIGATTCVCKPGDVKVATPTMVSYGMSYGQHACSVRTIDPTIYNLEDRAQINNISEGSCGMFVSDLDLASMLNSQIKEICCQLGLSIEDYARVIGGDL